jgi:signal transduction histidine kinase
MQLIENNGLSGENCSPAGVPADSCEPLLRVISPRLQARSSERAEMFHVFMLLCHELRSPLYTIRNAVRHFKAADDISKEETGRLFAIFERNVDRMVNLVEKGLSVMSVESGHALSDVSSDLKDGVVRAVSSMRCEELGRDIRLSLSPSLPERLPVKVKPFVIEQCVVGLIANALQYGCVPGGEHGCRVDVSLSADGQDAVLEVTDYGPGLPEEEQTRLFTPFYRAPSTQSLRPSGLGLGLALVHSVAESCSGSVGVRSRAGSGSTFWLRIPIACQS